MANFHQEGICEHLAAMGMDMGGAAHLSRGEFIRRLHNVAKGELQRIASGGAGDKDNPVDVKYSGDEDSERLLSTVLELAPKEGGLGMRADDVAAWLAGRARRASLV